MMVFENNDQKSITLDSVQPCSGRSATTTTKFSPFPSTKGGKPTLQTCSQQSQYTFRPWDDLHNLGQCGLEFERCRFEYYERFEDNAIDSYSYTISVRDIVEGLALNKTINESYNKCLAKEDSIHAFVSVCRIPL